MFAFSAVRTTQAAGAGCLLTVRHDAHLPHAGLLAPRISRILKAAAAQPPYRCRDLPWKISVEVERPARRIRQQVRIGGFDPLQILMTSTLGMAS
jgi:hypothetical protein